MRRVGPHLVLLGSFIVACAPAATTSPPPSAPPASVPTESPASAAAADPTADAGPVGCTDRAADVGDLTGVWEADDGGLYYLRHMGDCVWWFGTELTEVREGFQPGWANVAVGRIDGDRLEVDWGDVPVGNILGGGTLTLEIAPGGDRLRRLAETGTGFGGTIWTLRDAAPGAAPGGEPSAGASAEPSGAASPASSP